MKKAFIGLFIIAAGAAIFYLLQRKNNSITTSHIQKDFIIGKWKLDSLYSLKDSSSDLMTNGIGFIDPHLTDYQYKFTKDGSIELWLKDSLTKDSTSYEWTNEDQFVWKEYPANKTIEVFEVSLLNRDTLLLQSKDSVNLLFTKTN